MCPAPQASQQMGLWVPLQQQHVVRLTSRRSRAAGAVPCCRHWGWEVPSLNLATVASSYASQLPVGHLGSVWHKLAEVPFHHDWRAPACCQQCECLAGWHPSNAWPPQQYCACLPVCLLVLQLCLLAGTSRLLARLLPAPRASGSLGWVRQGNAPNVHWV